MNIREIIDLLEGLWGVEDVDTPYFTGELEIYSNPGQAEFGKLMREHGFLRGFLDIENNEVYLWNGAVLHGEVNAPGQCWLTYERGECTVQADGEAISDLFYDEEKGESPDISIEQLTEIIRGLRCMKPLLNNATLRVQFR